MMNSSLFIQKIITTIFLVGTLWLSAVSAQEIKTIDHKANWKIDSLETELTKPLHDTSRAQVLYNLSMELASIKPSRALSYANEGIKVTEQAKDDRTKARLLVSIGVIYQFTAQYSQAIAYYFKALRIGEAHGFISVQSASLNNIGVCYTILKQYGQAKIYMKKALALKIKHGLFSELGIAYTNLADIANSDGKLYENIWYSKKAIEADRKYAKENSTPFIGVGETYLKLNQLQRAKYYYEYALKIEQNSANSYNQIICYIGLTRLYTKAREYDNAANAIFKAKDIAENSGVKVFTPEIHETIAEMYAEQRDFKNAYIYKNKFHEMKDSALNETVTHQINEMQAKYESNNKDNEIELLNKRSQITEAKAESQKLLSGFLIMSVMLVIIISFILWRNVFLKQKVNKILNDKNEQLNEKNILLNEKNKQIEIQKIHIEETHLKLNDFNRELQKENLSAKYEILKSKINPHFLFNSLSSLSSIVVEDQHMAVEFIDRFSQLYRMILETGEIELITLEQELSIVNNYLYLQQMKFGENMSVEISIPEILMDYCIPPFALQMVIENAFKHNAISSLRKLNIFVSSEEDVLIIKNKLQKKLTKIDSTGTGQKNITGRYKILSERIPEFIMDMESYIVKLPLLEASEQKEQMMKL